MTRSLEHMFGTDVICCDGHDWTCKKKTKKASKISLSSVPRLSRPSLASPFVCRSAPNIGRSALGDTGDPLVQTPIPLGLALWCVCYWCVSPVVKDTKIWDGATSDVQVSYISRCCASQHPKAAVQVAPVLLSERTSAGQRGTPRNSVGVDGIDGIDRVDPNVLLQ